MLSNTPENKAILRENCSSFLLSHEIHIRRPSFFYRAFYIPGITIGSELLYQPASVIEGFIFKNQHQLNYSILTVLRENNCETQVDMQFFVLGTLVI